MITKKLICIECPKGCNLEVDIENDKVVAVRNGQCDKGEPYAKQEIENPMRVLTSTVLTSGLELKLMPVKTSAPIKKSSMFAAMQEIKKERITSKVKIGDIIIKNLLNEDVDLIATRSSD